MVVQAICVGHTTHGQMFSAMEAMIWEIYKYAVTFSEEGNQNDEWSHEALNSWRI